MGWATPCHSMEAPGRPFSPQEHVIHVWEETGSRFHNCLIQLYCEKVQGLMKEYLLSFPAGTSFQHAGWPQALEVSWDPRGPWVG